MAETTDPQPPDALSFEQIRQRDLERIRAKAAAGGALTDTEMRRLREDELQQTAAQPGQEPAVWVKKQIELAAALGCNRKTIQRYLKIEGEGAPPPEDAVLGFNVTLWRLWAANHGKLESQTAPNDDKQALERKAIELRNEKQEIENAVRRGELMHVDEVCKTLADLVTGVVRALDDQEHTLAPHVAGHSVPEISKRIRLENRNVRERLQLGEWAKKKSSGRSHMQCFSTCKRS